MLSVISLFNFKRPNFAPLLVRRAPGAGRRTRIRLIPIMFAVSRRRALSGGEGIRTPDPKLAKLVLSQLSYTPSSKVVGLGRFELPTSRLSGVRSNQLSYRPLNSGPSQAQRPVGDRRVADLRTKPTSRRRPSRPSAIVGE